MKTESRQIPQTFAARLKIFCSQNRRQKVFNRGALQFCGGTFRLCGGLDIIKLNKTPHIYSVSRFSLGGLGALLGGLSPPKPPRGDRTVCSIS